MSFPDTYIEDKANEIQRLLDVYKDQDEIKLRAYTVIRGEAQDIKRELSRLRRIMEKGMTCKYDKDEELWKCRLQKRA